MKQLCFESAQEAEQHLTKHGGKRVQWRRITTNKRFGRVYGNVFVTKRPWKKIPDRFSTILVRERWLSAPTPQKKSPALFLAGFFFFKINPLIFKSVNASLIAERIKYLSGEGRAPMSYMTEKTVREKAHEWAQTHGVATPSIEKCAKSMTGSWIIQISSNGHPFTRIAISGFGIGPTGVKEIGL